MLPINEAYLNYVSNFKVRNLTPLPFDSWRERHWGKDDYQRDKWADLENFWEVNKMIASLLQPLKDRKVF